MSNGDEDAAYRHGLARLQERLIEAMLHEIDQPHVVVCLDTATNRVSFLGPFDDALAAAVVAEDERTCCEEDDEASGLVYSVAPIDQREVRR